MKPDLIKIRHKGVVVFSSEHELVKTALVNAMIDIKGKYSDVTMKPENGKSYEAKKFVVGELKILDLMDRTYFLWLHKGMEITIRK